MRFSEEQVIAILREQEAGLDVSEAPRLKSLEKRTGG